VRTMTTMKIVHAKVAGRLFRITRQAESFMSTDIMYSPVDCRDVRTGIEAQAIVPTNTYPLLEDNDVLDAIASAYLNATGKQLTVSQRKGILPEATNPLYYAEWRVQGRYGYHAVEQFQPDNPKYGAYCPVGEALTFNSRKQAEKVAAALSEAFRQGAKFGAYSQS
jgi:hypothetical protein